MLVVVMGVAGVGKTTVGRLLAERLVCEFLDADDFHPPANVEKMRAGHPLEDSDRAPWLAALHVALARRAQTGAVLACSALKRVYRERLADGLAVRFVHLQGDRDLIAARLAARRGHYMNPALLASQFAALEAPDDAIVVGADAAPETIVEELVQRLSRS